MMKDKWKILYLGLDPSRFHFEGEMIHYPLICIEPKPFEMLAQSFHAHELWTHIILTSRTAVDLLFSVAEKLHIDIKSKKFISVGGATSALIYERGGLVCHTATDECAEGVIELLDSLVIEESHFFYPHAAQSRPLIVEYLKRKHLRHTEAVFYDTKPCKSAPLPSLEEIDEIIFTSPSTVEAFLSVFGRLPQDKRLTAIGPITEDVIKNNREQDTPEGRILF